MNKQPTDNDLQAQAMDNSLPDGQYLTTPKWGYSERVVNIEDGILSLASDGEYTFTQYRFFQVNNVIKALPVEAVL